MGGGRAMKASGRKGTLMVMEGSETAPSGSSELLRGLVSRVDAS